MIRDHLFDPLAWNELLDFGQHGHGAIVVERALHEDYVILHLDQQAVMGARGDVPAAVGRHLARHPGVRRGRLTNRVGHGNVHGDVGLDVADRQVEGRIRADRLPDLRRELHSGEVLVVRIADLDRHVAEHGVRGHGDDLLHQVLGIDRRLYLEAPGSGERDRPTLDGRVVRHRGLDDPVWRGPQLELPIDQCDRRRVGRFAHHVPGKVAARDEDLALLTRDGLSTAAARWVFALRPHELVANGGVLVVHGPRVALDDEPRPRRVRVEGLADLVVYAACRVLDRVDGLRTHRPGDLLV